MKKTYLTALLCGVFLTDANLSLVMGDVKNPITIESTRKTSKQPSEVEKARKRAVKASGGIDAMKNQTDKEAAANQQNVMAAKGDLVDAIASLQATIDETAKKAGNAEEQLKASQEMYEASAQESERNAQLLKMQQENATQRANLLYSQYLNKIMLMIENGQYFAASDNAKKAIVELKTLIATNQRMQVTKATMEKRIADMTTENTQLSDFIKSLKTEDPSEVVDSHSDEIEALNVRIKARQADLENLSTEHTEKLKKIGDLKPGQSRAQKSAVSRAQDLAQAQENTAYVGRKSLIENEVRMMQSELALLQESLKNAQAIAASSKAELQDLIAKQVQSAQKKIDSNKRAIAALPAKIKSCDDSYREGEQKIVEQKAAIRDMLLASLEKSASQAASKHEGDVKGAGLTTAASKLHEARTPGRGEKQKTVVGDEGQKAAAHG